MFQNLKYILVDNCIFVQLLVLCVLFNGVVCHETDLEKELTLTLQEKMAFDMFKSQVHPNTSQAHGFIKSDLFLLRWIRAKNLDVKRAVRDMFECLEWRRANGIDNIAKEDWSDMIAEHPYKMDITDLEGRPVGYGSIGGQWNIRGSVINGNQQRLSRYIYKLFEEIFDKTYQMHLKNPSGNITQFSVIASMEGFNIFQQGCPLCLSTYIQLISVYNRYYPNFAHAIIIINAPQAFSVVLDLIKPVLNKPTRDALKVFGYNQNRWKAFLDTEVSEDKLTREFGGTKPDEDD